VLTLLLNKITCFDVFCSSKFVEALHDGGLMQVPLGFKKKKKKENFNSMMKNRLRINLFV
jgi:hypothetical protein